MNRIQENGIDFLGIGAQKTASSWLWSLLKQHDDIWMPPRKELHYFDRDIYYPSPSFLYSDSLVDRLNGPESHNILFREKIIEEMPPQISSNDTERTKWFVKYFFSYYDDNWYSSLFEEGRGKLRGEITPSYSILNKKDISGIRNLFPSLKIILVLRNPIDRAWSQARFYMTRNKFDIKSETNRIKEFIDSPLQTSRSDYIRMLENWSSCFPKEQIFIGFYDEIVSDSKMFITKVCDYLGIDSNLLIQSNMLHKKTNVSLELEMPEEIKEYLGVKYRKEVEYLGENFGNNPKSGPLSYLVNMP